MLGGEGVQADMERMYPNKDGWLSVETVTETGERVTVFHGVLEVSKPGAKEAYRQQVLDAIRDFREQKAAPAATKLTPLYQGRVVVSLPVEAA
mmetsp:Transcript_78729/g.177861  ORF Transcript_78729/g.177861 Transcript_78729/m.177861 type:complete len:93 (+) Transcript_78729:79-357(+)